MSTPRHTPRPRHIIGATLIALVACTLGGDLLRATGNIEVITEAGTAIGNRVWAANTLPVVWVFNHPTSPAPTGCNYNSSDAALHAPAAALQANIANAFQAWEDNPDATIDFTYGGTTAVRNEISDGVNVVTFCQNNAANPFPTGVIARTPSTALMAPATVVAGGGCPAGKGPLPPPLSFCFPVGSYPAGTMVDSDIAFNRAVGTPPSSSTLSTDLTSGTIDVQATATHEIGHFHGLSHDPMNHAVMFAFIDVEPPSDAVGGQRVLRRADLGTSSRYYPTPSFGTAFGAITGQISLNDFAADGVHVAAIDPISGIGVMGRFAISRFEDPNALGPEGPDFAANGPGFYRIDGLPPGGYYVYVEYFDDSDFFSGRLINRYNTTVLNSNVAAGSSDPVDQVSDWLGFFPALTEFYNTGDSGNGGDGVNPGTALDNSDAATLVTVTAGGTTPNINIAINIEPVNGQTAANRQNPTTRSVLENDLIQGTDPITAFLLDGGNDDFYAVRFPAALLPAPPYNVAEGLWVRGGRNDQNFVTMLAFADPNFPTVPDLDNPVVPSAGRAFTGGPNGLTDSSDFVDVRDQWNVTVNQSRDVYLIVNQPPSPSDITLIGEGYFAMVTCVGATCTDNRVERTLITEDGGTSWGTITNADLFYDLILEQDPPVMITGATPGSMNGGVTGDVDIAGFGFQPGAAVSFGPNVTVNQVTFMSPTLLRANITAGCTGLTVPLPTSVTVTNPDVIFPNVSRVFAVNPPVGDLDCDGTPDVSDCAPGDPALEHAAAEVVNLTAASGAQLTWDSQDLLNGTATVYDIVTGLAGDLRPSAGFGLATCEIAGHPNTPFAVAGPDPPIGAIKYWLVRARNGCGTGTYGDSSIVPDPRDALDAGTPACP